MSSEHKNWLLCGGIGAGKSEVRRILARSGISTVDADAIGHAILRSGGAAYEAVATEWPEVLRDGEIDRSLLGPIVFSDRKELETLEAITHPLIFAEISRLAQGAEDTVVVEVPLLDQPLNAGWRRIVVDAPDELRLERIVQRGLSPSEALERLKVQPSRAAWLAAANLVIANVGSLEALGGAVRSALTELVDESTVRLP